MTAPTPTSAPTFANRLLRPLVIALATANIMLATTPAHAIQNPREGLTDPMLERRAQSLFHDLRCVVCQNQTIAESDAAMARDMRAMVRDRLLSGASDQDIVNEMHRHYGDFVLMQPPFDPRTWLLWGMPLFILALGGFIALRTIRHTPNQTGDVS